MIGNIKLTTDDSVECFGAKDSIFRPVSHEFLTEFIDSTCHTSISDSPFRPWSIRSSMKAQAAPAALPKPTGSTWEVWQRGDEPVGISKKAASDQTRFAANAKKIHSAKISTVHSKMAVFHFQAFLGKITVCRPTAVLLWWHVAQWRRWICQTTTYAPMQAGDLWEATGKREQCQARVCFICFSCTEGLMNVDKHAVLFYRVKDLNLNPSTQSMTVRVDLSLKLVQNPYEPSSLIMQETVWLPLLSRCIVVGM